ncbi:5-formyltetrahydrofolate cyclo-ligase [Ekhidna sp.]
MLSKSDIRKVILQYRKMSDSLVYARRNKQLCAAILEFINRREVNIIHAFLAIKKNREPDVSPLFENFWSTGKSIIVSKTDFMRKHMEHYYLNADTSLILNKKGIPEPDNAKKASLDNLDAIFVPLLVSDKLGYRIGYGGGYYDRLLAETNTLKVGLSMSPPVDEIHQKEDWDVPLDYLITPNKIYKYG